MSILVLVLNFNIREALFLKNKEREKNEKNHFNVICSLNGIWIYFKC